jgi:NHLM bacteriocin system ABC transporter ATP-binding protein
MSKQVGPARDDAEQVLAVAGPMHLTETDVVLCVVRGHVDLFAQTKREGVPGGPRRHLFRVAIGGLIFGMSPSRQSSSCAQPPFGEQGASTVVEVVAVVSPNALIVPQARHMIAAGPLHAWIAQWSTIFGDSPVCRDMVPGDLAAEDRWQALHRFHRAVLDDLAETAAAELAAIEGRSRESAHRMARIWVRLAGVILPRAGTGETALDGCDDPLLSVCAAIAAAMGESIKRPVDRQAADNSHSAIVEIARVSRLRVRRVKLRGDWWRRDPGALLAWQGAERRPVAVLPIAAGRWRMVDAVTGKSRRVDARAAGELAADAVVFYRSLPAGRPSFRDGAAFALRQGRADLLRVLLAGLALGLLSLAAPIIARVIIDSIIPDAATTQIAFGVAGLALASMATIAFQVFQNIATLRIESRLDATLQAAIIDRMLRLPTGFFRRYPRGELAERGLAVPAMRRALAGRVVRMLANLFALLNLLLMVWYDAVLGSIAIGFTLIRAVVIVRTTIARLERERPLAALQAKVSGLLLQLVVGLGKLKAADAAGRALERWSRLFSEQKRLTFDSLRLANDQTVTDTVLGLIGALTIFALIDLPAIGEPGVDSGRIVALLTAFGLASTAVSNLAAIVGESLVAVPAWERLAPVLAEPLEPGSDGEQPGPLSGNIEFQGVTFRYLDDGPPILDEVSFTVAAGECVAIVGPSGSGKSTIFRLLLGFEPLERGRILIDGKAIDRLDLAALRRQLGVVLQQTDRLGHTIYDTICGGGGLPIDRAWEAARLAGVADEILAMPMGMHTVLTGGITPLSGGQRQRLMIARALVHRPRILLLDEATSALDNVAQAAVTASLGKIDATRLIIAHRMSTVETADRIMVLSGGRIVQEGPFDALARQPGIFAQLIRQQLL